MILLTSRECAAVYGLISELSGGNPENVFAWDGTDEISNPTISGMRKLFLAVKARVPDNIRKPPPSGCEMVLDGGERNCVREAVATTNDGVRVCRECADRLTAERDPDVFVVWPDKGSDYKPPQPPEDK